MSPKTTTAKTAQNAAIPSEQTSALTPVSTAPPVTPVIQAPLVELKNATVRYADKLVLNALNWQIQQGEQWAIAGHNGAGKTTLLKLLRGEVRPFSAQNSYIGWGFEGKADSSPLAIRPYASLLSSEMQRHYIRQGWLLSGEAVILSGFGDGYMLYDKPDEQQREATYNIASQLGATHLLDTLATNMSQGQLRLVLLARAMVKKPRFLLLDEPFDGLDRENRSNILQATELAVNNGTTIVCALHRDEDIPPFITHLLELEAGSISAKSRIADAHSLNHEPSTVLNSAESIAPSNQKQKPNPACPLGPVFCIENGSVYLKRKKVLQDINWQVNSGEQWLLSGHNGSGKSTLLRVLTGEEHIALGGSIRWFGLKRTPTLQERQHYTGYVSDWLRNHFMYDLTGEELVLSGLHGTIGLYRDSSDSERSCAKAWIKKLGLATKAEESLENMSEGTARRFLLARALAPAPKLLILDEPCSGLDGDSRKKILECLPIAIQNCVNMIFVSHSEADLKHIRHLFTHELRLNQGKVEYCGSCTQS